MRGGEEVREREEVRGEEEVRKEEEVREGEEVRGEERGKCGEVPGLELSSSPVEGSSGRGGDAEAFGSHLQEADVVLTDGLGLQRGPPVHQLAKLCLQAAHQPPTL